MIYRMLGRLVSVWPEAANREIARATSIRFTAALFSTKFDIVEIVHVIKRADADTPFTVGFVGHAHVRLRHIIKVNVDSTFFCVANDLYLVPSLIFPWGLFFVIRYGFSWCFFDNHDLAAVRVRVSSEVAIVKMLGILPTEKHTAISVSTGVLGAFYVKRQLEICHFNILYQCNVVRASDLRFVVALAAVDSEDVIAVHLSVCPALVVCKFPAAVIFFKIIFEDKWEFTGFL